MSAIDLDPLALLSGLLLETGQTWGEVAARAETIADECEIQLSYSIGLAAPVSVEIRTNRTEHIPVDEIAKRVRNAFDFRLGAIVRNYALRDLPATSEDGFYVKLSAYGHLGRPVTIVGSTARRQPPHGRHAYRGIRAGLRAA